MATWRDLAHPSNIGAGFVAVLVGFASAVAIVFQAAQAAGANDAQIVSWVLALGIGMGVGCIALSWYYRMPILIVWSTPGAALLVTGLSGVSLPEATAAFIFAGGLALLLGLSGWFERIMRRLPMEIASAMLAGILLQFGLSIFVQLHSSPMLVGIMLGSYILAKHLLPRYSIIVVLAAGTISALLSGDLNLNGLPLNLATPEWVTPEWNWTVMLGVGLPLFIVSMTSQNVPGIVTLRANGYDKPPVSSIVGWTGAGTMLLAPFGGFFFNLAAITAAICASPESHPDKHKRYAAAIHAGFFNILAGLGGTTVVALFAAFPQALVATVAGLALLSTIGSSLSSALKEPQHREAALLTFLVTVSGVNFFGLASAFWGIVVGVSALMLLPRGK